MAISTDTKLLLGSSLVAMSYGLAASAAYSILSTQPDMNTRPGRHLLAGALAIGSLSAVEVLIAIFPLRRGERFRPGCPASCWPMRGLISLRVADDTDGGD